MKGNNCPTHLSPEVFLKSPEKNETIFQTEVMFLSCLVWIGMTSQKPNRWLTRWNVSGEDDRGGTKVTRDFNSNQIDIKETYKRNSELTQASVSSEFLVYVFLISFDSSLFCPMSNWNMSNFKEIKFISVLRDIIIVTKDFIRELETIAKRDMRRQGDIPGDKTLLDRAGGSTQPENCSSRPRKESGYQRHKYVQRIQTGELSNWDPMTKSSNCGPLDYVTDIYADK